MNSNWTKKISESMVLIVPLVLACIISAMASGCTAGSAYTVQSYEVIAKAAGEVRTGTDAMYAALVQENANDLALTITNVGKGVYDIAKKSEMTEEQAVAMKDKVVALLAKRISDMQIQKARIDKVYLAMCDNLSYITQICSEGKDFTIYRMDIDQQWKQYMMTTAENSIQSGALSTAEVTAVTSPLVQAIKAVNTTETSSTLSTQTTSASTTPVSVSTAPATSDSDVDKTLTETSTPATTSDSK